MSRSDWLALGTSLTLTLSCAAGLVVGGLPAGEVPLLSGGLVGNLQPLPTEVLLLDYDHKSEKKSRRKAWFKEMHRTAPGTDWKKIERRNGLLAQARRNRLGDLRMAPTGRWTERGSQNQAGRAHVGVFSLDQDVLYAGTSRGGLWRGTVDGTDWEPIGDNLYGGVHWLRALTPASDADPDILVVATDDGLIHTSDDDGQTWDVPAGIPAYTVGVRRMTVTTDGQEALFFVLQAWDWGTSRYDYFLYRSVDQGQSIQKIRDLGAYAGDVWVPRDGSAGLYLLASSTLYFSDDLGDTWETRGTIPGSGRQGELAGSEAGAPRLWSVVASGGGYEVYRSDDAGQTWTRKKSISSGDTYVQYWNVLEASMEDEDLFAHGGMEFFYTRDGGDNFTKMNDWGAYYNRPWDRLHADIQGIEAVHDPSGEELWLISTDGGLYRSTDDLATVENLSLDGLRISQYYSTYTSTDDPDLIAAGAQDQGYQTSGHFLDRKDDQYLEFEQVISGDYGHIVSADGTHDRLFSVYPGYLMVIEGDEPSNVSAWSDPPSSESGRYYAWIMPLEPDPTDRNGVFVCFTRLYRYAKSGGSWVPTMWSEQSFSENQYEYLSAFRIAPSDPDRAYAATSYGQVYVSDDMGVTWDKVLDTSGPDSHYFYGSALLVDPDDEDTVYLGGSGYDGPAIYRSTDGGQRWSNWAQGLPSTLIYDLAIAANGTVFAAGEQGAYRRSPTDSGWVDITGNEAPITTYWSVEYVPAIDVARFGTYGRGIWDYQVTSDDATDGDNDGYDSDLDCNDADATINPGAQEICGDGIDQDCDGDDMECPDDTGPAPGDDTGPTGEEGTEDPPDDGDIDTDGDGCGGCASTTERGASGAWLGLLVGLTLVRRGRRRRG